jgi:hypothetical protein
MTIVWQVVEEFLKNVTAIPAAADFHAAGRGYPGMQLLFYRYSY